MFASLTTLLFPLPTFTPVVILPPWAFPAFPGFFLSGPFLYVFLSALTTSAADRCAEIRVRIGGIEEVVLTLRLTKNQRVYGDNTSM